MGEQTGKILVVEPAESLKATLLAVLSEAGYEVSTDYREGMKAILAFEPDLVVLGADPPQLDCCDLLSEIKGSKQTRQIRVVMLVHGNSGERTRGLDLGADDALSLPFDPSELLSRIRTQLRSKQDADELAERIHTIAQSSKASQRVVKAVNRERRTFVAGAISVVLVLIIVGATSLSLYHRGHVDDVRVYAAITHMQSDALSQQKLVERSHQNLASQTASTAAISAPQPPPGTNKVDSSSTVSDRADNTAALKNQMAKVEGRLEKLENEGNVAHRIISEYEPSVCLIHVALTFRDRATGLKLRYSEMTSAGEPTTDKANNPLLSLTGSGPEVQVDVFGTGFLASDDGQILTNHHVAEPWWQNDDMKDMLDQGLEPVIKEMTAYFPRIPHGVPITTTSISSDADVAVVRGNISGMGLKHIALAAGRGSTVGGAAVVLLGYPTGVDAILARTGSATLQAIAASSQGDSKQVMEELAHRHLIEPLVTQGHIGDVLKDKIVYDAQTTSGGSGGPLFNNQGQVIGINFAILRDFGGSNFAIPVRYARPLLKP
jgi:DNA-binding response OmpR family regulator/S1-C subfamily serine protease